MDSSGHPWIFSGQWWTYMDTSGLLRTSLDIHGHPEKSKTDSKMPYNTSHPFYVPLSAAFPSKQLITYPFELV